MLQAEGVGLFVGTYGPVYQHKLWNLQRREYRIFGNRCPVAENLATRRVIVMPHPNLGATPAVMDTIGRALVKVAAGAGTLRV